VLEKHLSIEWPADNVDDKGNNKRPPFVVDIESGILFIYFFLQTTHAARSASYLQLIAAGGE